VPEPRRQRHKRSDRGVAQARNVDYATVTGEPDDVSPRVRPLPRAARTAGRSAGTQAPAAGAPRRL